MSDTPSGTPRYTRCVYCGYFEGHAVYCKDKRELAQRESAQVNAAPQGSGRNQSSNPGPVERLDSTNGVGPFAAATLDQRQEFPSPAGAAPTTADTWSRPPIVLGPKADAGEGLVEDLALYAKVGTHDTPRHLCNRAAAAIAALQRQLNEALESERLALRNNEGLRKQISEMNMHQQLQDSATAAVMERAERAEAEVANAQTNLTILREGFALADAALALALAHKDSARYRRLRENWIDCEELHLHGRLSAIDAAVDAAMSGEKK